MSTIVIHHINILRKLSPFIQENPFNKIQYSFKIKTLQKKRINDNFLILRKYIYNNLKCEILNVFFEIGNKARLLPIFLLFVTKLRVLTCVIRQRK